MASVPSLTEATIDLHLKLKGVGPSSQLYTVRPDQPLYIGFDKVDYPNISLRDTLEQSFDPSQFKDRIVLIGSTFTQRRNEPRRTPLSDNVADLTVHADAITCLLDNEVIYSFPRNVAHHLLLLLGAAFGAIASILPLGLRAVALGGTSSLLIFAAQIAFQQFHQAIPVVPPLAVLILGFTLGTFIYLIPTCARETASWRKRANQCRCGPKKSGSALPKIFTMRRCPHFPQWREWPIGCRRTWKAIRYLANAGEAGHGGRRDAPRHQ